MGKINVLTHQSYKLSRLDIIKMMMDLPIKYLKLNEKENLETYTAIPSEIVKMKDKFVSWTKNGSSIKI